MAGNNKMAGKNGLDPSPDVWSGESDDSFENRKTPKKSVEFGKETFYSYDKGGIVRIEHGSLGRFKEEEGYVRFAHGTSQLAQSAHRKRYEKRTVLSVSNGGGRLSNVRAGKLQKGVVKLRIRRSHDGTDDPDGQRVKSETKVVIPEAFFVGSPPMESLLGSLEQVLRSSSPARLESPKPIERIHPVLHLPRRPHPGHSLF